MVKNWNEYFTINENINVEGNKVVITKDGMTYGKLAELTGEISDNKLQVKFDSGFVGFYKPNEFVDENTFNNKFDYKVEFNNLKHQYIYAKENFDNFKNRLSSDGVVFTDDGEMFPDIDEKIFKG